MYVHSLAAHSAHTVHSVQQHSVHFILRVSKEVERVYIGTDSRVGVRMFHHDHAWLSEGLGALVWIIQNQRTIQASEQLVEFCARTLMAHRHVTPTKVPEHVDPLSKAHDFINTMRIRVPTQWLFQAPAMFQHSVQNAAKHEAKLVQEELKQLWHRYASDAQSEISTHLASSPIKKA